MHLNNIPIILGNAAANQKIFYNTGMKYFERRLKILRLKSKLSQKQLAKLLNVCQSTICAWENGIHEPNIFKLIDIAKLFKVSTDYLIGLEE